MAIQTEVDGGAIVSVDDCCGSDVSCQADGDGCTAVFCRHSCVQSGCIADFGEGDVCTFVFCVFVLGKVNAQTVGVRSFLCVGLGSDHEYQSGNEEHCQSDCKYISFHLDFTSIKSVYGRYGQKLQDRDPAPPGRRAGYMYQDTDIMIRICLLYTTCQEFWAGFL